MRYLITSFYLILTILYTGSNGHAASIFTLEEEEDEFVIYDPLERYNRKIYQFNNFVDEYAIEPLALGYRSITTPTIRKGFDNFFFNIRRPVSAINSALQQDYKNFLSNVGGLLIDSTIGILGIFKVSHYIGISDRLEDFGQTLAVYDVGPGPYLMLPIFGPSNLRDASGSATGAIINTTFYEQLGDDTVALRVVIAAIEGIATREKLIESLEDIEKNSLDPYVAVRSIYYQHRQNQINNGNDQ